MNSKNKWKGHAKDSYNRSMSSGGLTVVTLEGYPLPSFESPRDLKDRDLVNYIKSIERSIRGSFEYHRYLGHLINEADLSRCAFLSNVDVQEIKKVHLEFHHHPYTLYDIVLTVFLKRGGEMGLDLPGSSLMVAEEVVRLHYEGRVGLVPLTRTVHQLFHSGELFIPTQMAHGDVASFTAEYWDFVPEQTKGKVLTYATIDFKYEGISVLDRNVTMLSIPDREAFRAAVGSMAKAA